MPNPFLGSVSLAACAAAALAFLACDKENRTQKPQQSSFETSAATGTLASKSGTAAITAAASTPSAPSAPSTEEAFALYESHSQAILSALRAGNTPAAKVAAQGRELKSQGMALALHVKAGKPECAELIDLILKDADSLHLLEAETIESRYHAGTGLPEAPEVCKQAKELVVHPALVVALAKGETVSPEAAKEMEHELQEVLGHLKYIQLAAGAGSESMAGR